MSTIQAQCAWPLQKPQQLVYVELGTDNGGMMLGICEQGFSYRAVSPLRAESPVNFTFALDGKTRLEGTGEIVWSEEDGKTGGLKFTTVSAQFRESLREWLASESTPKTVGREVTPAVALPLDSLSEPKKEVGSTIVQPAKPTVPPLAEAKPPAPKLLVPALVPAKPTPQVPVESGHVVPERVEIKPPQAKPLEHVEPEQLIREIELHSPKATAPPLVEAERPEARPVERAEPELPIREAETNVPTEVVPLHVEPKPIEAKLVLPKPIDLKQIEPSVPEPELRTVAPLLPAETPSPSVFSLPNFRLPSALAPDLPPVPHLPMEEIAQSVAKTLPVEGQPAKTLPGISSPESSPGFAEVASRETETPVLHHEPAPSEIFGEDIVEESPRLNRAAATGIIGLALAVILAAIVLSFRHEVGEMLIRTGQMLAGEEHKPAVALQPVSSAAPAQTPQSGPTESSKNTNESAARPGTAQPPKTVDQTSVQTREEPSSSQQATTTTPAQTLAADSSSTIASPSGSPPTSNVQRVQDLPPPADGGNGQKEFERARNILKGKHHQQALSLVVNLLWTAVRKGNVPAEVTLADLYVRGDGVARNCAQARVLLDTAVQKGSPEARRRLGLLKRQGCG